MRTIEIVEVDGSAFTVSDIPDDAKITFAGLNPGAPGQDGRGLCIRIYKGASNGGNQLAVFRGVHSFRDLSLRLSAKAKKDWVHGS